MTTNEKSHVAGGHDSAEHLAQLPVEPEMPENMLEEAAEKDDAATSAGSTQSPAAPR